jgi:hypothetical protein
MRPRAPYTGNGLPAEFGRGLASALRRNLAPRVRRPAPAPRTPRIRPGRREAEAVPAGQSLRGPRAGDPPRRRRAVVSILEAGRHAEDLEGADLQPDRCRRSARQSRRVGRDGGGAMPWVPGQAHAPGDCRLPALQLPPRCLTMHECVRISSSTTWSQVGETRTATALDERSLRRGDFVEGTPDAAHFLSRTPLFPIIYCGRTHTPARSQMLPCFPGSESRAEGSFPGSASEASTTHA